VDAVWKEVIFFWFRARGACGGGSLTGTGECWLCLFRRPTYEKHLEMVWSRTISSKRRSSINSSSIVVVVVVVVVVVLRCVLYCGMLWCGRRVV